MGAVHVAIGVENEFAAVLVSLPFGDHLHINGALDGARDKHPPERTLTEWREFLDGDTHPARLSSRPEILKIRLSAWDFPSHNPFE